MKNTIEEPVVAEETAEDIQKTIDELKKRKDDIEAAVEEDIVEKIELPVADIMLQIDRNTKLPLKNITPPEALVLVAEHHKNAGGNPISEIKVTRKITIDPVSLRGLLCQKYNPKKVFTIFPGSVPQMPKTFRRAMLLGIDTNLPKTNLMDFEVASGGAQ